MVKYIVISPVRNEEMYFERTLKSMVAQTIKPIEWIIVDDGSTDNTRNIIAKYLNENPWIIVIARTPKSYHPGAGVVQAFYDGFSAVKTADWDYVVKLDGDLEFDKDYFEQLFFRFTENSKLGMASGKTFVYDGDDLVMEPCIDSHVRGASKVYKRACYEAIEQIPEILGWDTLDEIKAQMNGWETRSFKDLRIIHLRRMSFLNNDWSRGRTKLGKQYWILGYHPIYLFAKSIYRMFEKPYVLGGYGIIYGYLLAWIRNEPQYYEKRVIDYIRAKQKKRLYSINLFKYQEW